MMNWKSITFKLAYMLFTGAIMWMLIAASADDQQSPLHAMVVPALVTLLGGLFILRNERHWSQPARELEHLLPLIRSGKMPIEEMVRVGGGMTPLAGELRSLLHELRQQKVTLAELNEEIRQRVAMRTTALERQIGSLREQASRDALTGLYNRRFFDACFPKMVERCAQEKIEMSLLMIDIDNFKLLNDTLGHPAGDELLRNVAQIIRSGIRECDAAFRLGGDEFVIILPGCDPEGARALSQRLQVLVERLVQPMRLPKPPMLSIGFKALSEMEKSASPADLLEQADRNLYQVKAARKQAPAAASVPLARAG